MMIWTNEAIKYLADNYGDMNNTTISENLGTTKNAVCGKASRLGLSKKRKVPRTRRRKEPELKPSAVIKDNPVVNICVKPEIKRVYGGAKTLMDIGSNECRYPHEGGLYCADKVVKRSYCQKHYELCYSKKDIDSKTINS